MNRLKKLAVVLILAGAVVFISQAKEKRPIMESKKQEQPQDATQYKPLSDEELKKTLTAEQYEVTQQCGTEPPFKNAYWNNKKQGIYVDITSGKPLFSSTDKFDSGTGWPSFFKPLDKDNLVEKSDTSYGRVRTEVKTKNSDSHLGHVFNDGPKPTGLRYCINSAALRFIPLENMEKEGYGKYLYLFGKKPSAKSRTQMATFGAGCFWGVESAFRQVKGVVNVTVGYMGGTFKNPTYEDVCTDKTGHAEVLQIEYDPAKVSYEKLLEVFWNIHDPTTLNKQGPDTGTQYRSVIFYYNKEQENAAKSSKDKLQNSKKFKENIVTEIVPAKEFYKAEEYHQRYYEKKGIEPACHIP